MSIFRWPEEHTGQTSWSGTGEREHFAQFYDDESVLLESVAGFVQNGIETGAAIVLVVTEAHRATLGRRWRSLGLDTAALRERGQFVVLDAAQTLARIMDGDRPDRARLFELAHGFLAPMAGRHGRIAIFGEMVTLLWKALSSVPSRSRTALRAPSRSISGGCALRTRASRPRRLSRL